MYKMWELKSFLSHQFLESFDEWGRRRGRRGVAVSDQRYFLDPCLVWWSMFNNLNEAYDHFMFVVRHCYMIKKDHVGSSTSLSSSDPTRTLPANGHQRCTPHIHCHLRWTLRQFNIPRPLDLGLTMAISNLGNW